MINPSLSKFLTQSIHHLVNPLFRQISISISKFPIWIHGLLYHFPSAYAQIVTAKFKLYAYFWFLILFETLAVASSSGLWWPMWWSALRTLWHQKSKIAHLQKNRSLSMDTMDTQYGKVMSGSKMVRDSIFHSHCTQLSYTGVTVVQCTRDKASIWALRDLIGYLYWCYVAGNRCLCTVWRTGVFIVYCFIVISPLIFHKFINLLLILGGDAIIEARG